MSRFFVCGKLGDITAEIEVEGIEWAAALEHEQADPVIGCAVLMALAVLAQGGKWPMSGLELMSSFLASMNAANSNRSDTDRCLMEIPVGAANQPV